MVMGLRAKEMDDRDLPMDHPAAENDSTMAVIILPGNPSEDSRADDDYMPETSLVSSTQGTGLLARMSLPGGLLEAGATSVISDTAEEMDPARWSGRIPASVPTRSLLERMTAGVTLPSSLTSETRVDFL